MPTQTQCVIFVNAFLYIDAINAQPTTMMIMSFVTISLVGYAFVNLDAF